MLKTIPTDAILIPDTAKMVFEGIIFDVYHWQQQLLNGGTAMFEMVRRADTIRTIGVVDGKLLMMRELQPHKGYVFGFPGGRANDTDESWLAAAQRELREETGYSFANWRLVHVLQPEPKNEWFMVTFLAWGSPQAGPSAQDEGGEQITTTLVDFKEAKQQVMTGRLLERMRPLFDTVDSIEQLLALPEFQGKNIDR